MEASSAQELPRTGQAIQLKKACTFCRQAHAACDGGHPCQRCVGLGQTTNCHFLPARKRGRPPKGTIQFDAAPATSTTTTPTFAVMTLSPHATTSSTPNSHSPAGPERSKRRRSEPAPKKPPPALVPRLDSASTGHPSAPGATVASRPSLLRRTNRPEPASPPPLDALMNPNEGISGTILTLLAEQMRDMRRENRHLRDEVRTLSSLHKRAEHRIEEIQEENRLNMERILNLLAAQQTAASLRQHISPTPYSQPIDPVSLMSRSQTPPRMRAIIHILPFLADYDLWTQPVVVDDLTKPFAAFSLSEPDTIAELAAPTFIYASPSFCHVTGFELHELLGHPITLLCDGMDLGTRDRVAHFAFKPVGGSRTGPVFQTTPSWSSKKQPRMNMRARSQFFFNDFGKPKWFILVCDDLLDSSRTSSRYPQRTTHDSTMLSGTEVIYDDYVPAAAPSADVSVPSTLASYHQLELYTTPAATISSEASPESSTSGSSRQSFDEYSANSNEEVAMSVFVDNTAGLSTMDAFNPDDLDALWKSLRTPSPGLSYP